VWPVFSASHRYGRVVRLYSSPCCVQAHPAAVCNPVSHQCNRVIGKEGEMVKTLDKDEQMDRKMVKTLDRDEKVITGKMARGRVNKFEKDEEIIAVYQPYKKLAR
jgi:hypothetical protein